MHSLSVKSSERILTIYYLLKCIQAGSHFIHIFLMSIINNNQNDRIHHQKKISQEMNRETKFSDKVRIQTTAIQINWCNKVNKNWFECVGFFSPFYAVDKIQSIVKQFVSILHVYHVLNIKNHSNLPNLS